MYCVRRGSGRTPEQRGSDAGCAIASETSPVLEIPSNVSDFPSGAGRYRVDINL